MIFKVTQTRHATAIRWDGKSATKKALKKFGIEVVGGNVPSLWNPDVLVSTFVRTKGGSWADGG